MPKDRYLMDPEADHTLASRVDHLLERVFSNYDPVVDVSASERRELNDLLWPGRCDALERYGRLIFQASSKVVPERIRRAALGPLRTLRRSRATEVVPVPRARVNRKVIELETRGRVRRAMAGFPAVCLTFDVDLPACYAYWPTLLTILEQFGVRATFHVLTHATYRLDWGLLAEVQSRGHEIGLHGASHDIALGYRSRARIRDELRRALSGMPFQPKSYRAPGLCMTMELMEEVRDAGFRIDSSLPTSDMYYKSVQTSFPYKSLDSPDVFEVPISLMDTNLFSDLHQDDATALDGTAEVLRDVTRLGGACTLVLHPSIAAEHPVYLRGLMELLAGAEKLHFHTLTSVVDHYESAGSRISGSV